MANLYLSVIVILTTLFVQYSAVTDELDVMALKSLYIQLNLPPQLKGWKLNEGSSPCAEYWLGVSCSGSSVISVKIQELNLTGYLGFQLSKLHHLKELDVSSNNFHGTIPYSLPLNATRLNLAFNNFSGNIPSILSSMSNLQNLNLSHNSLVGPLGDFFQGLPNVTEMDLSFNNFSGDLPSSFAYLTNLNKLFLQDNGFTGSVILLAVLPLSYLNIQNNNFSGVLPYQFRYIQNLWLDVDELKPGANDLPWDIPMVNVPPNITSPPTAQSAAIESHPSKAAATVTPKNKKWGPARVAGLVGGIRLLVMLAAIGFVIQLKRLSERKCSDVEISSQCSEQSFLLSIVRDDSSGAHHSLHISTVSYRSPTPPRRITPRY